MINAQLVALLKIHPEEIRMVSLMAVFFLCVQAGQGIGENAAFALFLSTIDVDFLPYMYIGLGGVVFIGLIFYSASLSRFQNSSVVVNLLAATGLLFAVEWILILSFANSLSYPVLWLTTYGVGSILGTLLWTTAGEVCDARQAKRLFPLFASMGILGSVLGNLLTGVIAALAGADSLILSYALLLGAAFLLARRIADGYFKPEPAANIRFNLMNDVRAGYDFARGSRLFRLIAVSSILYSILYFTVDFPFSERISSEFMNDAAGLAGFRGLFTSITTAVTFMVSLFLANRLYARLGIVNSVLIMPITYLVAFALFFVSFNFWGAVGARFGQLVILGGVAGTAWNALFNVVPSERRGQVLAFNNGVPTQIGVVLSGLLILLSKQVLGTQNILLLGALVALVTAYMTMKMRSAYGEALLSALRAGRAEVFSEDEEAFSGYRNDPDALQVILKALHDPRAATRRLAAEMLSRMDSPLAIPDLLERLSDEEAGVRAAAIRTLADLDARLAFKRIISGLDDPDDAVREETLASLPKLGVDPAPELIHTLEHLLTDPNPRIGAHAAAMLLFLGENESAEAFLSKLAADKDVRKRHLVLDAFGHMLENSQGKISFNVDFVLAALTDPSPLIRRDAIHILSQVEDWTIQKSVLKCLSDEDAGVRKIASETLKQAWSRSRGGVIQILESMDEGSLDSALGAIPPGDPEILDVLRAYVQREMSNIRYLRTLIRSLPAGRGMTALLVDTLKHRDAKCEERLVRAVGLFGNPRALDLVRKSLNAGDAGARAAALEALETLGDPTITKEILPILDRGGTFQSDDDQRLMASDVIGELLISEDDWLRAIAARVAAELRLREHRSALQALMSDPVRLVKEAAADALSEMDGNGKMKTLKTLSTLDRILLLREIPMFSRLSPEDLERIAEVAQEQLFPAQTVICREGEPGDSLFIIVHGSVQVIKGLGKKEMILAERREGQFVGEMAILESSNRSATLRAATDVRMLVLDGESFKSILRDRPEVAISVLQNMSSRFRELNERVGVTS